ncbi:MAG: hypothetical protein ACD_61C00261G0003 [uncultured bacterium]|nr:MAG: hypothetical protein ACD_61C00261G0003 [uncultured bacterium]
MENDQATTPIPVTDPKTPSGLIFLLLTIIIVLFGSTACLFYQYRLLSKQVELLQTVPAPAPTPTPGLTTKTVIGSSGAYRITIPGDWKKIEFDNNLEQQDQFQAPDGSILTVNVFDANKDSLKELLSDMDKIDATGWEGKPGKKILSSKSTNLYGLPAIEREEILLAADYTTIATYGLIDNKVFRFSIAPSPTPYKNTEIYTHYTETIDSFEPLSTP